MVSYPAPVLSPKEGTINKNLGKTETPHALLPDVREASVSAAAELVSLYARLGRMEELRAVMNE